MRYLTLFPYRLALSTEYVSSEELVHHCAALARQHIHGHKTRNHRLSRVQPRIENHWPNWESVDWRTQPHLDLSVAGSVSFKYSSSSAFPSDTYHMRTAEVQSGSCPVPILCQP